MFLEPVVSMLADLVVQTGVQALHFSVTGCSAASAVFIKLLLDASADGSVVDENDNWCNDLIVLVSNSISGSKWWR